ncbi:DDE-type integrase/transposase/recombinase [Azospirillum formosense]|uniref:DDE-type integrase/transposase/recombinase n=1 Tax=Azospirillum formosense TaxID=861533 RepID=A0ABX2KSG0_9PROT|nr:DDE-type integrase/transposase/recombinase [Azospirillum formosense]MBY3753871.1 transposase family protein [Azospirillum formosense]NUB18627.1 DDE-type integrase/transposase/recombinase [Azospirillum formosense]
MAAIPLKFQPGDTLAFRNATGGTELWGIVGRKRGGYLLRPFNGSDPRTWSDDEIDNAYGARRLIHFPCNVQGLPKNIADILEKTWDYWPEEVRRHAERRTVYVAKVDALIDAYPVRMEAYAAAAEAVYTAHCEEWKAEDTEFAIRRAAEDAVLRRRRKPRRSDAQPVRTPPLQKPNPYTIRAWYVLWSQYGRDIRLLIPHRHLRGNRQARYPRRWDDALDTYKIMRVAIEDYYMRMPRKRKNFAYSKYEEICAEKNVPCVSFRSFRVFIDRNYTERAEFEKRYGRRAAYLKYGIFERTTPPERPLEEVEVDHCLIDLIAVHPLTGRPLGRPWLTIILDRATRVILGAHLSFEVPSYASLQRALAHAFWKKDLTGIEGLEHDWPCHGIPEWVFCDNGKELRSKSLRLTEAMLNFAVFNLPRKTPWLKGAIERLFGSISVQVFSHEEGTILSRTKDFYDPVARARLTLAEVNHKILKWIVDEYHEAVHPTIKCRPIEKWRQLTELYPVRPIPDFDHIIRMTGEVIEKPISNVGVHYKGLLYSDPKVLEELKARRGGLKKKWIIRVDPYDYGEIWIFDDDVGRWYVLPCTDPAISRNVSKYQHNVHKLIAKHNLPPGTPITVKDLENAKTLAQETVRTLFENGTATATAAKAARYEANGQPFTPLLNGAITADPQLPPPLDTESSQPSAPDLKAKALAHAVPSASAASTPASSPRSPARQNFDDEIERMVEQWASKMK